MKVLLVSSSSGSRGGGELYLLALSRELIELGHEVVVMLADADIMDELAEQFDSRVDVIRFPYTNTYRRRFRSLGSTFDSTLIRQLSSRFRSIPSDVIHLNLQNLEDGLDLVQAAERSRVPYAATIHITRPMSELGARFGTARDIVARRALRSSSGTIITISHACQTQMRDFLGCRFGSSRISCIPNGVPNDTIAEGQCHRAEWGFAEGDFILGCIARIEEQKNPLFAVRLISRLPDHVKLVWVGDGSMRAVFESLATELGVAHRIHVDGWRRDARSRMGSTDTFILPSLYEGLPLALLEAMACGLPIIASSVDGMTDVIDHGTNGLLAPPNDMDAWCSAIRSLIESPEKRSSLGAAARESFLLRYSSKASAEATLAVYHQVIERAAVSRSSNGLTGSPH